MMKGSTLIENKLKAIDPDLIYLTSITASELLYGARKNKFKSHSLLKSYAALFDQCEILDFDLASANEFSKIKSDLKLKGSIIEDADIQIASIAKANNMILVTDNNNEFKRIDGIIIENWSKE